MDDAHEHGPDCEHGETEAFDIPEVYMPLVRVLASHNTDEPTKLEALICSAFRKIALARGLPVARALTAYVLAASAMDQCVRRLRYRALGQPIDREPLPDNMLETGRTMTLHAIDELVAALGEARAAYEVLYLEPDGVHPKEESRAVMSEAEKELDDRRAAERREYEEAIKGALGDIFAAVLSKRAS